MRNTRDLGDPHDATISRRAVLEGSASALVGAGQAEGSRYPSPWFTNELLPAR